MTTTETESPGAEIAVTPELEAATKAVLAQVASGKISLTDVLKALVPDHNDRLPAPANVPLPAKITEKQKKALERLTEVYGKVVPTERRALQPTEIEALGHERETLDEIAKMAKARIENIRTTVYNHLDVEVEAEDALWVSDAEAPLRDDKGFYIRSGEVTTPDLDGRFTREEREGSPTVTVEGLQAAKEAGFLSHAEFLACTRQVRLVDENGIIDAIRKNPAVLRALAQATTPGKKATSHYYRPKKS